MLGKIKYRMKKSINIKNSYLVLIGTISLFLIVGGFSYALFTTQTESKGTLNIITGNLYSYLESEDLDTSNSMSLNSGETKVITISLQNLNVMDAKFNLWYEAVDGVNVSYDDSMDTPPTKDGYNLAADDKKTYKIKITNNTDNAEKITFGSDAGLFNKDLSFPENKKLIEGIVPKINLDNAMIPVVYNGTTWVKASEENWYDYDLGKWANAVTVSSASRSKYQSAASGTEVVITDIYSMWVYIPRYSYTIGSEDGTNYYGKQGAYLSVAPTLELPGEIDVKFIGKTEKDAGSAQYKVAEGVSGWRTPDAFTFGGQELAGIWVGKFETASNNSGATCGGGNVTNISPIIRPDRPTWRCISVSNIGEVSAKITASGNTYYGVSTAMDSHAIRNTEWASVSYLSQSKYGKLGNRDYQGVNKEIYQNKSNEFIAGCSSGAPSSDSTDYGCHYKWDKSPEGTGASTTGTIYGIYDMSGGAWEYVMGVYTPGGKKYVGENAGHNSGYTGLLYDGSTFNGKAWLADKYYDFYTSNDGMTACNGKPCISHGWLETKGWYDSHYYDSWLTAPYYFAYRGGNYNLPQVGVFAYFNYTGEGYAPHNNSFRIAMIQK